MQGMDYSVPSYKGKTAVLLGLGKSGLAAAKLLHSRGAKVKVSDLKPKDHLMGPVRELQDLDSEMEFEFGANSLEFFSGADFIVSSSSVPKSTGVLMELRDQGIPSYTELELALREVTAPLVAIVGSYGKTTTAAMAKMLLEQSGKKVSIASDLHGCLSDCLRRGERPDLVLLELRGSQLEKVQNLKPDVVVFTCLHKSKPVEYPTLEDYLRVQMSILKNADDKTVVIYNFRDAALRALVPPFPGRKRMVRRKNPNSLGAEFAQLYQGSYLESVRDLIWTNGELKEEFDLREANIFGLFNKENLMSAVSIAKEFGCKQPEIQHVITHFPGIPHRLEFIRKRGGVRFINDSRSTSPDSLFKSLKAFKYNPIVLIAGGKQMADVSYQGLGELVKQGVKTMILVGESKEQINRDLGDFAETYLVGTFEEAVLLSYQKSCEGDVILLSPGSESYDMFTDYEERGNYFTKYLDEF